MKFKKEDLHKDGTPLSQEEFINKIKTDDEFAKKWGELGPIYGKQWRSWNKKEFRSLNDGNFGYTYDDKPMDQIANLINELKTNPDSRRLMVNAWHVGEIENMILPPCHYGFQVYTRELSISERVNLFMQGKKVSRFLEKITNKDLNEENIPKRAISLMWNQRSVDTPLGLPFNIASYGLLLEIIAKVVNMVPDELIGNLGDTHIYLNQVDGVKEQIGREPFPLPKLNINTEFWSTESGECGVGNISVNGFIKGLNDDNFIKCLMEEDIQLSNYQSHPSIKIPLSN